MDTSEEPSPELLPAEIGFTKEHLKIGEELIHRLVNLLQAERRTVVNYSIAEGRYSSSMVEESMTVRVGNVSIAIGVTTEKK